MAKKFSPVWAYLTVLLAALVGLAMTPLASAQDQGQTQQTQQKAVTATGCLQKAASGEGYQLTDSSTMKTYDLTAASSDIDLSAHVGHTVTVTGTPQAAPAAEPGANPAGQPQNEQISVTDVKMVSSTCQNGGGGGQ